MLGHTAQTYGNRQTEWDRHVVAARTFPPSGSQRFLTSSAGTVCSPMLASACLTHFAASVTHSQIEITYFTKCAIVSIPKICRGSRIA